MIHIGIDPGTHTGIAVWDGRERKFLRVDTMPIHQAMDVVSHFSEICRKEDMVVVFEDARQRTWFGNDRPADAKLQGAGSIKRDCSIWEDFLNDYGIKFHAVPPQKGGTKLSADYFKRLTGWEQRTSNHARDAAMLVFGR